MTGSSRLAERVVALAAVLALPLMLLLVPLPRLLALCDRWPRVAPRPARPPVLANRVRRWLSPGRGPWRSTCLTRSVVLYAMLRQHGHAAEFNVGVAGSSRAFDAHAWVAINGHPVEEAESAAAGYRLLVAHHA